ncbi:MAG TPA: metalloregulator ArsR/SmtB family transcription factor [Lachnospiraceae bacterium]|nr:metalloregulator ArsR/SmtB family transcription factor [Lachnospiraceae bacterium]
MKVDTYENYVPMFKALGDATRLKIVEMLSCGELCACDILESFDITQPTLSYHMKILTDCGIVISRKEGSWIRYHIDEKKINDIETFWKQITTEHEDCICRNVKEDGRCES